MSTRLRTLTGESPPGHSATKNKKSSAKRNASAVTPSPNANNGTSPAGHAAASARWRHDQSVTTVAESQAASLGGRGTSHNAVYNCSKVLGFGPEESSGHSSPVVHSGECGRADTENAGSSSPSCTDSRNAPANSVLAVDPGQACSDGCSQSQGESLVTSETTLSPDRSSSLSLRSQRTQPRPPPRETGEDTHDVYDDVHEEVPFDSASMSQNEQRSAADEKPGNLDNPNLLMRDFGWLQVAGASIGASALHQLHSKPPPRYCTVVIGHSLGGLIASVMVGSLYACLKSQFDAVALPASSSIVLNEAGLKETLLAYGICQRTRQTAAQWFVATNHDREWRTAEWNGIQQQPNGISKTFRMNHTRSMFIESLPDFEGLRHLSPQRMTSNNVPVDNLATVNCFPGNRSIGKSPLHFLSLLSLNAREHMQAELSKTSCIFIQIVRRAGIPELLKCGLVKSDEKRHVHDQWINHINNDRDPAQMCEGWSFFISCMDDGRLNESPVFCVERVSIANQDSSQCKHPVSPSGTEKKAQNELDALSLRIILTFQISKQTNNLIATVSPAEPPATPFLPFGIVVPALESSQNDDVVNLSPSYFVSDSSKQTWKVSPTLSSLLLCFDSTTESSCRSTSPDQAGGVSSAHPENASHATDLDDAMDRSMEVDGLTATIPQHFAERENQSDDAVMLEDAGPSSTNVDVQTPSQVSSNPRMEPGNAFTHAPEEGALVEAAVEPVIDEAPDVAADNAAVAAAESVAMEATNVEIVSPPAHVAAAPTPYNDDWPRGRDWDLPELDAKRRRVVPGSSIDQWPGSAHDLLDIIADGSSELAASPLPWVCSSPDDQYQAALVLFRGGPDGVAPHERKRDLVGAVNLFRRLAIEDHHVGAMKWFSRCLRSGWGVDVDMASGNEWCRRAADAGDVFCVGLCFSFGLGCVTDLVRAHACIMAAANAGDPCGMNAAGVNFDCGEGVAKDYAASRMWYERAYAWGDIAAINNLACCYRDGHGVMRNVHRAIGMFEAAAASGDVRAMNNLGQLYSRGAEDLAVDAAAGHAWYRRAADKKNAAGMCSVGICYALGRGVPKDDVAAFDWYSRAAHLGEPAAMINLALLLRKGLRGVSRNLAAAGEWLAKAANAGNVDAIRTLAMTYLEDKAHCSSEDVSKAVELFRRAAAQGDAGAMNDLGWAFDCGYIDMAERRGESAIYWFQRSADAGCPEAYNNLGACYEGGRGVPREPLQALHYYCVAAQLGHEGAAAALNREPFLGQSRLDGLPAPLRPQSGPAAADAPPTFVR